MLTSWGGFEFILKVCQSVHFWKLGVKGQKDTWGFLSCRDKDVRAHKNKHIKNTVSNITKRHNIDIAKIGRLGQIDKEHSIVGNKIEPKLLILQSKSRI